MSPRFKFDAQTEDSIERSKKRAQHVYQPKMARHLSHEDRRSYEIAFNPDRVQESIDLAKQRPSWQDSLHEMLFMSASSNPQSLPEILSLAVLDQDAGGAANRRYGDRLDPYYRNATGGVDEVRLAEDQFILDLEGAFYGARGKVPMGFFLDHIEDLNMLGPEYSDTVEQLYAYQQVRQARSETEALLEEEFDLKMQRSMDTRGHGRAQAEAEFVGYERIMDQLRTDQGWTTEQKVQYMKNRQGDGLLDQVSQWFDPEPWMDPERNPEMFEHDFTEARLADLAGEAGIEPGEFRHIQEGFGARPSGDEAIMETTMDVLGGLGVAMNAGADGIGWLASPIWSDGVGEGFKDRYESIFGPNMSMQSQNAAYKDALNETIGMSDDQFVMQMGLVPAIEAWASLPQVNPEEFNLLMSMAGGDKEFAQDMFTDMVLADPGIRADFIAQAQEVRNEAEYQLQEMEDENFTAGDALLDLIAVWGEGVENIGTTVATGVEFFRKGKGAEIGMTQFWQDVRDNDTPAGVYGLEGTLTGLGINLLLGVALDPLTYIFGPRLSASGRMGATTADDVLRMSTHPASGQLLVDIQQIGRGHATGAIAYQSALDTLAVTSMDELMMAASRGSVKPITSSRPYLAKFGKVTDDVAYNVIDDLIDPEALKMATINKAQDRIAANGLHKPIEITVNPDTGAHALTSGAEDAAALHHQGIDAIPTTVKLDPNFGLSVSDDLAEWSSKLNVVDGHMAVDDLTRLRRYDFDAEMRPGLDQLEQHPMVDSIARQGVQKPLEVVVDISSSPPKVQLMNGNHRLAAAKAAGLDDVPVNVRIKRRDLDKIPGVDDGRPAPFKAQEDFNPPTVADESLPIADWGKGIRVDDTIDIDGVRHIRPRRSIGESIYGDVDIELMQNVYRKHLAKGGDPIQGIKTPMATSVGAAVGDMFRSAKAGSLANRVTQYMTPINANIRFEFTTTVAKSNINQFGARLYGSVQDALGWEPWAARINDFFLRRGELRLAGARSQQRALQLMDEMDGALGFVGGNLDNWGTRFGVKLDDNIKANHRQVTTYVDDLQRQIDDIVKQQKKMAPDLNNYTELHQIMDEFLADFKKTHIDSDPRWVDELVDGEVPWEALNSQATDPAQAIAAIAERAKRDGTSLREAAQSELGYVPKEMDKLLKFADDVNINKFLDEALHSLNTPTAWIAPASPLEIMAAASGGPRAVKTVIENAAGKTVADGLHTAHTWWMLDKVMTPRTAAVVSLDELMRIWHTGGSRSTFAYLEDKAMGTAARVTRAKTNVNSWNALPNRWKDRISALEEYPIFYRQLERSFLEPNGVGFDDIVFKKGFRGNDEYYTAARRTAGQLNTDEGFQAFLQGKTAFREWFESAPGAQRLRDADFFDAAMGGRRSGATWHEVYAGYETTFERWALSGIKDSKKGAARAEWSRAAEAQSAKGSAAGGVAEMPEWVLEGFQRVTGNKQGGGWKSGVNKVSDALFQGPVDYRRGFLAEWVRKSENARLAKLYESQGMRVVSDGEMLQLIRKRYPSVPDEVIQPHLHQIAQEMFEKSGVVTQRFVSELVENKVIQEMENMLYSFHMNSRAGRASKAVAPFGKPWADMWGFWGREIVSRPQLRGYINNANFMNLGQIANKVVDHLPFNPRTTAYMSRLAATDFNMDRIEDDPIVGQLARSIGLDRLDVGPAMFLPKGGENPFMVMLPGLGLVPSGALHGVFRYTAPDPLENPIEYQAYLDQWSQFIPGLSYNRPTDLAGLATSTAIGGGVISRIATGAQAANLMLSPGLSPGQATLGEDWQARIAADRQVQVIFQDEDIWAELAELPPEMADIGLSAYLDEKLMEISKEASQVSGRQQFMEEGLEMGVPVRSEFNTQREDLNSVWLDSIEWMGLELPEYYDTGTESGQAEAADWARNAFYKLPDWERDTLVTDYPGLAVNMVSMWEWDDKASDLGIPDTGKPYRSGGSNLDLKAHETYRQMGLIRPISTRDFAERIIGTVLSARTQTARGLYMETAKQVNNERWQNVVDEEWKEWLDHTAGVANDKGLLPYRSGRELWENYNDLQNLYDTMFDPDVYETIGLPQKQRAWGERMPSDPSSLREDFQLDEEGLGYPVPIITPQMQRQADSLGIVLGRDTEMHEIYGAVANEIAESYLENPIFAYIGPEYKAYLNPRSAGHQATQETLGRVLDHENFEPETVNSYRRTLVYLEEAVDRKAMGDDSWLEVRDEAVADWKRMAQDDAWGDLGPNILTKLWDDAYGSSLGALDWTPDEPAPLRLGPNEFNPDASPAFVRRVVDGDTMDVVFETGTIGGGYDTYRVRLLGTNQPELGTDEGYAARDALSEQVQDAIQAGLPITIVRDPRYGNTDMYGRIFAWVYIGEDAIYAPETMIPRR